MGNISACLCDCNRNEQNQKSRGRKTEKGSETQCFQTERIHFRVSEWMQHTYSKPYWTQSHRKSPGKHRMQESQLLLLIEKCSGWNPQGICQPSNFTRSSLDSVVCSHFFSIFVSLFNCKCAILLFEWYKFHFIVALLNWLIGDMDTARRLNAKKSSALVKETSNYVMRI